MYHSVALYSGFQNLEGILSVCEEKASSSSCAWRLRPVIPPTLKRQRKEDCKEFEASLYCGVRAYVKNKTKQNESNIDQTTKQTNKNHSRLH